MYLKMIVRHIIKAFAFYCKFALYICDIKKIGSWTTLASNPRYATV